MRAWRQTAGRPSLGLLLLRSLPVDGGQYGRGDLPTSSSTAPHLEAAADAVQEWGRTQVAALGDEQAGVLQPAERWRQQLPAEAGNVGSL